MRDCRALTLLGTVLLSGGTRAPFRTGAPSGNLKMVRRVLRGGTRSLESKELRVGETLGRYQLLMPIAKGGMGQVWAARQSGTRGFHKMVAVKTIIANDE